MRCDNCGRFTAELHDVWANAAEPSIDMAVCGDCAKRPLIAARVRPA